MRPVTADQLRTIDETAGFDVDIPQELQDLVDGKVQTVSWEDEPDVSDIYANEPEPEEDAWDEQGDIDVEDLYDDVPRSCTTWSRQRRRATTPPSSARTGSFSPSRRRSGGGSTASPATPRR